MPVGAALGGLLSSRDTTPDSVVLNITADDYDGANNEYIANIGPNVPDESSDPTVVSGDINGHDVVNYDGANDASQTDQFSTTADPVAIILTAKEDTDDDNGIAVDGASFLELAMNDDDGGDGWKTFRGDANTNAQSNEGTSDTNYHVYALIGQNGDEIGLETDGSTTVAFNTQSSVQLSGLTIGSRGDLSNFNDMRLAELTVLNNFAPGDKDREVQRQGDKYGITIA